MHVKNISLWPKLLLVSGLISILLGIFVAPEVKAASNTPTASCNGTRTSCTVSFPYSGDYYVWSPPADVRTMSISLSGAQGGRSGGTGTKLNATLRAVPSTPLYIFVGGQGSSGNNAAGGYNGGGSAGAGHGDEGSGGGATDIRTGLLLTDRFAVAAGGGGTGGWVGGSGGSGNATTGSAGGNGQGTGGGGGTPSAGGAAGVSFGANTSSPSAGSLGQGGNGGSANTPGSTVAGGGGGGGGYYGGGGGGADTDPVGVDGGGGGAGSSYANSTKLQSISYYTAFQVGDGQASITYNFGPSVTSFTTPVSPSNLTKPVFNLTFGQSVTGLTADAFTFSGTATGCYVSLVTGSGANYAVTVSGCSDGSMALSLKADTVMGNAIGPIRPVSTSTIILDRTLPELSSLTKQPSSNDLIVYKAIFSETVSGLSADATDWLVKGDGCILQSMTGGGSEYVITLSGCLDGHLAGLVLNKLSVVDTAGNIGPSLLNQTGVTMIDTSAPIFHVIDVTDAGVAGLPTWIFDAEEPVTGMSQEKFSFAGTATGCSFSYSVLRAGLGWKIRLVGCSVGTTQVTLAANSVSDAANNIGPVTALASNVVTITPDEVVNQSVTPPETNNGASTGSHPKSQNSNPQDSLPQGYVLPKTAGNEVVGKSVENQIPSKMQNKPAQLDFLSQQQITYGLIFIALALSAFALVGKRNPRHRR